MPAFIRQELFLQESKQFDAIPVANDNNNRTNARARTLGIISLDAQIKIQRRIFVHWLKLEQKYASDNTVVGKWAYGRCQQFAKLAEDMILWLQMKRKGEV